MGKSRIVQQSVSESESESGVTEYFDPLKILARALISQKKWAPSHKKHLIFYLDINSTAKFIYSWI